MMHDRVVLITGGLGRLGVAMVKAVESAGGIAVPTTRSAGKAANFNERASEQGFRQRAVVLSLESPEAIERGAERVLSQFGSVNGLVNNAYSALPYRSPGAESWNSWLNAARIGLAAPETLASTLVKRVRQSGISSIVNISSIYGLVAPDPSLYVDDSRRNPGFYGAIKAGVLQHTRYCAVEWAKLGVRVNAVTPGGVFAGQDRDFLERYNTGVPTGRMVTADEVAEAVLFLLSNQSSGIVGQNIVVDAGRTIM